MTREADVAGLVERVARAISFQDEDGWQAMPEDDRERLYDPGKWREEGQTREDYRDAARAALAALSAEPGAGDDAEAAKISSQYWRETPAYIALMGIKRGRELAALSLAAAPTQETDR